MIDYITVNESGQIYSCGCVQDTLIDSVYVPNGTKVIQGISISDPAQYYWNGSATVVIPDCPSENHVFDYQKKTWNVSADKVRRYRDKLLKDSDWTQLPDVPVELRNAWSAYRQALRDITQQPGFPNEVIYPIAPV